MPIGSSLGITLPTQGGNSGTWGTDLNTELQKVIDAVEAQVPASAIDFSADFDMNDYGLTSVRTVACTQQSSVTELNAMYFDTNGDFYIRDGLNNAVQITNAGVLNNASAGGLGDSGGDYGTSGITFDWDGTNYNAKSASGDNYAPIRMSSALLRDNSTNTLTLATPSLSSDYTITFPSAVPGSSGTFLQSDTSGTITFSNSTGVDITLTGSAEVKHGSRTLTVPAAAGIGYNSAGSAVVNHSVSSVYSGFWESDTAADLFLLPIPLKVGDRLTSVVVWFTGSSTDTKTARLKSNDGTGTVSDEETNTSTTSGDGSITLTVSPQLTIAAGESYTVVFEAGATGDQVHSIDVTYDRP
jgi:hypothetical protein